MFIIGNCVYSFQLENRVSDLVREKEDLEARVEDDQDEIEGLLEKQRAHISHTSGLQSQLNEATIQIGELEESKVTLESRVCLCSIIILYNVRVHSLFTYCFPNRLKNLSQKCPS